ncbi:MAG: SCO6745 family protein [Acidimicrobiales bacterium]
MDTDQLMASVCPAIRDNGWAYYFAAETDEVGKGLGLDLLQFYFLGRGGVLGDVEAEVVVSAFGYFNPETVRSSWDAGRRLVAPRVAARAHFSCCAALGRSRLGEVSGLEEFCAAAGAVNDAADYVGLPLYAGFRAEPLAADPPGRALQLMAILRELRGGAHLLAVRASGLDARTAHAIARPGDQALFGWSDDDTPQIGPVQREAMTRSEALTDALVRPAYDALDRKGADALRAGVEGIAAALAS